MSASWRPERLVLAMLFAAAAPSAAAQVEPTKTVEVQCTRGEEVASALTLGDERKPLLVIIHGTCAESVVVSRSDVTLRAGPGGGGIAAPDTESNAVEVTGSRVTIEGLTVTGGLNGIVGVAAAGLVIRNVTVSDTGRNGIALVSGASARIEDSLVERNPRDGVVFESASGLVLGSTITGNRRIGVAVVNGGSARIGVEVTNVADGSTITSNGASGVVVSLGGSLYLAASEVSGNGTDARSVAGRNGVTVVGGSASLIGGNTIANNASSGVAAFRSASITIGDRSIGLDPRNTISGNGAADSSGGVFAFQGSTIIVTSATVRENVGFGLGLGLRSAGQVVSSTFSGNWDGIRVYWGSGLFVGGPGSVVSGNSGFGVSCPGGEATIVNSSWLQLSDNVAGNVAPECPAF